MTKKIAIIGAGIAGLTAGYYLKRYGFDVTVYEASNRIGGRMTSDTIGHRTIDLGAQFLSCDYQTIMPLIDEIGLTSSLTEISPWVGVVRDNHIRAISPYHFFSPLSSGYLKLGESIKFLSQLARWRKRILGTSINDYAVWSKYDDANAADFTKEIFGEAILEYVIEPQMQGYYFQEPEKVSKILALMLLNFLLKKGQLVTLQGGIGLLPKQLAAFLEVKTECEITALEEQVDGSIKIHSASKEFIADKVILATTGKTAKKLFANPSELEKKILDVKYSKTINVNIATSPSWKLPTDLQKLYGCVIPQKERTHPIAAFSIETNKDKNRSKQGELINVMVDGFYGMQSLNLSDEEILQHILPSVNTYLPGIKDSIEFTHIVRWNEAMPITNVGRCHLLKSYYEDLSISKGILLAGDYMGLPFSDSAAFSGKKIADFMKKDLLF
jgi:oxygen-dependent protoporphyrinogen oxidase